MSVQEQAYPVRLGKENMQKIRVLAAKGRRSINMQLCIAVERYLEEYEAQHGPIVTSEDGEA